MRVEFSTPSEKRRLCAWTAYRGKRIVVPGSVMAAGSGLPHDLGQYVVEAATGYEHGFWGLVAMGATFKSSGRRRTRPGRAVIADHRRELDGAEALAGEHLAAWAAGRPGPVADALTAALEDWRALRIGDRLVFEWPAPRGVVVRREVATLV